MGIKNEHMLGFPCDIRFWINMQSENYIGNPLYQASFANSIDFAKQPSNAQTLAEVVVQVRKAISQVTPARIGGFYSMIESKDAKLGGFLAGMMAYKMVNGVSNQTRFNIYKADFGSGVQSFRYS
ncbi:hypothetical protein DL89DRAFT_254040 [Linderina pennispora]|uniref:Uncharacterized protein n=1 Tax=Linderina pennispora TaxID=61395 RepID=A0A1Y1WLV2_9FUNG|nr:uncharacterized protein DL89DRAFT_254040 [Linderina pennispora]ORX74156.1 hypothetical protein DL89DRAFT_254040 [Linderina pennispora]